MDQGEKMDTKENESDPNIAQNNVPPAMPPVSPGKILSAESVLSGTPPDASATQKVQIEYLKKMVSALVLSFTAYKYDTEKRMQAIIHQGQQEENEAIEGDTVQPRKTNLKQEIDALQNQLNTDIGQLSTRCEVIENRLKLLEEKHFFDFETTIVAQHVPITPGKETDIIKLAEEIVWEGTETRDVKVVRAKRLESNNGKPGLLKIELDSVQDKVRVLRNKPKLRKHCSFSRVYIRSSKSHAERIMESNMSLLLQQLPIGNHYRLAGNGRLVQIDNTFDRNRSYNRDSQPYSRPYHNGLSSTASNQNGPFFARSYENGPYVNRSYQDSSSFARSYQDGPTFSRPHQDGSSDTRPYQGSSQQQRPLQQSMSSVQM